MHINALLRLDDLNRIKWNIKKKKIVHPLASSINPNSVEE